MKNKMKQTAVEWFAKQVLRSRQLGFISNEKFNELLEQAKAMEKEQMIGFHKWMLENDTPENAERFFHFSDNDMLNEYLKAQKL